MKNKKNMISIPDPEIPKRVQDAVNEFIHSFIDGNLLSASCILTALYVANDSVLDILSKLDECEVSSKLYIKLQSDITSAFESHAQDIIHHIHSHSHKVH